MTDKDGFATIDFQPGAFTRNASDPLYSDMASGGSATIQAVWKDKQGDTTVSFRNYPYLSVNVSVEPQVVNVTENVSVTIRLIGDGWALQKKPIDVVLCTDRSGGSMLQNTTYDGGESTSYPNWVEQESIDDRMVHAMRAAKNFTAQMQSSKDRIGLVSFGQNGDANLDKYSYKYWAGNDYKEVWHDGYWGWESDSSDDDAYIAEHYKNPQTYSGPATRDLNLTSNYGSVNATIDKWLPPCGGTPMREGLYQSVRMIKENPRTGDPVKAIVLLTDGEYSTNQNPEGGGNNAYLGDGVERGGSVIEYAKRNNIKIFTIALGNEPSHSELQNYSKQTGGTFYSATAGDDLTQVYAAIATKLQEAAGVNTTMNLAFDKVEINSAPVEDVFEYVSSEPSSTKMIKYWTANETTIQGPEWKNQSEDWVTGGQSLSFKVGDIYRDQTWETTFKLKVLKEGGNIDIFGNGSIIKFNGTAGPTELRLPHTFITASQNLSETDIFAADILLTRGPLDVDEDNPGTLVPPGS
ncbi:VWA domain-containing protein [Methanoculleus chikugoensis]|uniref:vWA domain-containing protein n=1 Tax=Methanoculleus chikugoensis TaxID=118126 RepID=UPI0006D0447B|nr:vWA domain-containing protein [Methanoculleus chikugoensis]